MLTLLLSSPMIQLYLLLFTAFVLAHALATPGKPRSGKDSKISGKRGSRHSASLKQLESSCRADYASRFSQALKRIRRGETGLPGPNTASQQRRLPVG